MKAQGGCPTSRMMLGKRGEEVACRFLEANGHSILHRNYRAGHLEIDIISMDRNGVHFVEVKSRVAPVSAAPEENVTVSKQKSIASAALKFLHTTKDPRLNGDTEAFFDVVAVTFDGGKTIVDWFPDAFIPMYF